MEIKNLNTFIQVAELGSFTKTAEKLGYSQSTISFQIKQLEKELDTQLFERINHTVTLTDRGREVLQYAHQISKLAKDMEKQPESGKEITGHIRIAMADSLCRWLMEDTFAIFQRQYPGITLKIIAASTEEMFRLLNHNEVDLVYTLDKHIYNREYIIAKEEKVATHFVAAKKHSVNKKNSILVEDIVKEPLILTEKGMSYRRLIEERLASLSLEMNPVLEIGNTDLILRLVEQGMGISFLPDYVTEKSVEEGKIVRLNIEGVEIDIWKQLLYHRDKWFSPQMKAVIEYL